MSKNSISKFNFSVSLPYTYSYSLHAKDIWDELITEGQLSYLIKCLARFTCMFNVYPGSEKLEQRRPNPCSIQA